VCQDSVIHQMMMTTKKEKKKMMMMCVLDESQSIGKSGEEMEKKLEKLFDLILMIS
jgi:hypothetical protein